MLRITWISDFRPISDWIPDLTRSSTQSTFSTCSNSGPICSSADRHSSTSLGRKRFDQNSGSNTDRLILLMRYMTPNDPKIPEKIAMRSANELHLPFSVLYHPQVEGKIKLRKPCSGRKIAKKRVTQNPKNAAESIIEGFHKVKIPDRRERPCFAGPTNYSISPKCLWLLQTSPRRL